MYSPLEQFILLPVANFSTFNFSINNIIITFLVCLVLYTIFFLSIYTKSNKKNIFLIPNRTQMFFENLILNISSLIRDNINSTTKQKFLPIVGTIFIFILTLNLFGIIPYTFTITSELIITFCLSFSVFVGIQIIGLKMHKIQFFSLFFPSGVSVYLALLLVPIELISFIFKPVSLSVRLFANMMAGHTLLKVIAGFIWLIMSSEGWFSLLHLFPLFLLIVLFGLEIGVAVIQTFVFTVLFCIYINDIFNLH
jgi:ATP synthase subunit 6